MPATVFVLVHLIVRIMYNNNQKTPPMHRAKGESLWDLSSRTKEHLDRLALFDYNEVQPEAIVLTGGFL